MLRMVLASWLVNLQVDTGIGVPVDVPLGSAGSGSVVARLSLVILSLSLTHNAPMIMIFMGEHDFNTKWLRSKVMECWTGVLYLVLVLSWHLGLIGNVGLLGSGNPLVGALPCVQNVAPGVLVVPNLAGYDILPDNSQGSLILALVSHIVSAGTASIWFLVVWPSCFILALNLIFILAPSAASWSTSVTHLLGCDDPLKLCWETCLDILQVAPCLDGLLNEVLTEVAQGFNPGLLFVVLFVALSALTDCPQGLWLRKGFK